MSAFTLRNGQAMTEHEHIASLIRRASGVDVEPVVVFRCAGGCGREVPHRLDACAICTRNGLIELRAQALAAAYDSVSPRGEFHWAKFGQEQFAKATNRARVIAAQLPELEQAQAMRVFGLAAWSRREGNMVLLGPSGIGKTTAMRAIGLRILDAATDTLDIEAKDLRFACGVRFVSALDIARARATMAIKHSTTKAINKAQRILGQIESATLLLIDELGSEDGRFDPGAVRDAIELRYRERRPMIVTTGKTLEEISDRYGEAVARKAWAGGRVINLHRR